MFDLFGRNRNDNERDDGHPRIIFANLRRPSRPILTEAGYKVFSATAFSGWALVVLVVWIFRVEVSLSKELVTSLAGSSVELSALSLAVLGILHELNKEDRWFKLGLLLVSILFVGVVFGGFFLALTWQPAFDLPQQITIVVIAALGLVAILQIDWRVALRLTRIRWIASVSLPTKISTAIRRIRLAIPFVLPIVLVWLPDLNRVTAVVVLFAGALIALVVLMTVTTFSLLKSKEETEPEDPFIATLRARYENEIESLIRLGELKARTVDALRNLQGDKIRVAIEQKDGEQAPAMVEMSYIAERLRQMGITEEKRVLESVVSSLVDEKIICRESYSGPFWTIPDDELINASLVHLEKLALIISTTSPSWSKSSYSVEGYTFTRLRDWLALNIQIPTFVVGEYIVPKMLKRLLNEEHFYIINKGNYDCIFINKRYQISRNEWQRIREDAKIQAEKKLIEKIGGDHYNTRGWRQTEVDFFYKHNWYYVLKHLPHTQETDLIMNVDEIVTIASIMTK